MIWEVLDVLDCHDTVFHSVCLFPSLPVFMVGKHTIHCLNCLGLSGSGPMLLCHHHPFPSFWPCKTDIHYTIMPYFLLPTRNMPLASDGS